MGSDQSSNVTTFVRTFVLHPKTSVDDLRTEFTEKAVQFKV